MIVRWWQILRLLEIRRAKLVWSAYTENPSIFVQIRGAVPPSWAWKIWAFWLTYTKNIYMCQAGQHCKLNLRFSGSFKLYPEMAPQHEMRPNSFMLRTAAVANSPPTYERILNTVEMFKCFLGCLHVHISFSFVSPKMFFNGFQNPQIKKPKNPEEVRRESALQIYPIWVETSWFPFSVFVLFWGFFFVTGVFGSLFKKHA